MRWKIENFSHWKLRIFEETSRSYWLRNSCSVQRHEVSEYVTLASSDTARICIGNRSVLETIRDFFCTREQIGLFRNFHEWLPRPRVEIRKSPICSQVQLIPYCFEIKNRFPLNKTATVNSSFYLTSFRYRVLLKWSHAVIEYFSFVTLFSAKHFSPKFSIW